MTFSLRNYVLLLTGILMLFALAGSAHAQESCTTSADCGIGETCSAFGVCMQPEDRAFQPLDGDRGTTQPRGESPVPSTIQSSPTTPAPGGIGGNPPGGDPGIGGNPPDVTTGGTGETLVNPLKVDSVEELLNLILEAVIQIGVIVLVLALIWTGFLFIKAQGKPEELAKARQAFIWTIIGGLILLGAKGISEVIQATATNL